MIRLALRAVLGTLKQDRDFEGMCLREIYIDSGRGRVLLGMDGEVREVRTPLRFRSWVGALKVLAPVGEGGEARPFGPPLNGGTETGVKGGEVA
jgi:diacylglycerol kinase family enzyme